MNLYFNLLIVIILVFYSMLIVKVNCGEEAPPNDECFNDRMKEVTNFLEDSVIIGLEIGNYSFADQNVWILREDPESINWIVQQFYTKNASNFATLIDYARNTSLPKNSYFILHQLLNELKSRNHQNPIEFCEIHKILVEKVNSKVLEPDYIAYGDTLLTLLRSQIMKSTISSLKSALEQDAYDGVQYIADHVYKTSESLFDEAICQLIGDSYNRTRFGSLLRIMWTHKFIGQKAVALSCVFQHLQQNMDSNLEGVMIIAYYLYKIKHLPGYTGLAEYNMKEIESNIKELPGSIQHLYFEENISIRNLKSQSYIAPDFFIYKKSVRGAYLQEGGQISEKSRWYSEPVNFSEFKFRNKIYDEEYLYADDSKRKFTKSEHLVLSGKNVTEKIAKSIIWQVMLKKNGNEYQVRMVNDAFNEYLCLSEENPHLHRSVAYKYLVTIYTDGNDPECQWTVDACTVFE